jgi:hypothetical protein
MTTRQIREAHSSSFVFEWFAVENYRTYVDGSPRPGGLPAQRDLRRELLRNTNGVFGDLALLLGGRAGKGKGRSTPPEPARSAVLDFAEASQRFLSRARQGQPNNEKATRPGLGEAQSSPIGSGTL